MFNNNKKRERALGSSGSEEDSNKIFARSKKVIRSPDYYKKKEEEDQNNMDEVKKLIKELMVDIKNNTSEVKEMKNEMKQLREEIKKKEEKWEMEKTQLIQRVEKLEERFEKEEKEKRKNNIVITGIKEQDINENTIKKFIKDRLEIDVGIKNTRIIMKSKGMVIAEIESFAKKIDILKNKYKLKDESIYIESDLTIEERKIQADIRKIARENKEKGNLVKVGYQKKRKD